MFGEEDNSYTFDEALNDGQVHDIDLNFRDATGQDVGLRMRGTLNDAKRAIREHNATARQDRVVLGRTEGGPRRDSSSRRRSEGASFAQRMLRRW